MEVERKRRLAAVALALTIEDEEDLTSKMFKFTLFITQMLPWLFCPSETAMQFYVPRHDAADADPILLGSQDWLPTISSTSTSSAAGLFNHQRDLHNLRGLGVHAASKMFKFTLFITQLPKQPSGGASSDAGRVVEDGADNSSSVYSSFAMTTASSSISQNKASRFLQDAECTSIASLQRYDAVRQAFVRYNTTLPSSASVEGAFSVAAHIFTKKRGKMSDATFESQLLLKINNV
ncbi:hypothetical protein HPB47_020259 [Ixodes persulcatus]|uniref:Uncharacterized protein n=1 Tax=Ixodes persulcatus TaxID=34615 RepID=A0AC60QFU9_IXOPE|nr:hypothetical protein HPB47_020259 [Ixodes persulcatus]